MATRKVIQINHYNIQDFITGAGYSINNEGNDPMQYAIRRLNFSYSEKTNNWLPFNKHIKQNKRGRDINVKIEYWNFGPACMKKIMQTLDPALDTDDFPPIHIAYCCESRLIGFPIFIAQEEAQDPAKYPHFIGKTGMLEIMEESFQDANNQKEDDEGNLIPNEVQVLTPKVWGLLIPKSFYFETVNDVSRDLPINSAEYKFLDGLSMKKDEIFEFTLTLLFENQNTT